MRRPVLCTLVLQFLLLSVKAQIVTTPDTTICLGGTAVIKVLSAVSYGTSSYTFETIPYAPEIYAGTSPNRDYCGAAGGGTLLGDDCFSVAIDIGFSFCFLNNAYTECYIGSNGWVSFSPPPNPWTTFTSATIPSLTSTVPKNCIMGPWQDWQPDGCAPAGSCIKFQTLGVAPNRKFVVSFDNVPMYSCTWLLGKFQIVLNETTNIIENHITDKPNCLGWAGGTATQGVHSADGLTAYTAPGRNSTPWTASNESTRFVPSGITWYDATGLVVGFGDSLVVSPTVTTTYTCDLTGCDGVTYTADVTVTVIDNDPDFNYSTSYCTSGTALPIVSPDPGGTFTAAPGGLVIDPVTGEIDLDASATGFYTITYSFGAPCFETATDNVSIINDPDPAFTYPDISFCPTGSVLPDYIATAGGTFSVSPAGLVINAATGSIDLTTGVIGTTYTITYTVGLLCTASSTFTITISDLDDPTFAYSASSYCPTGTTSPTVISTPGGSFTVSPPGLSVNPVTGMIDLTTGAVGTTYTITYTTPAGPCSDFSSVTVTIDPLDDASFSYPSSTYCPTGYALPVITGVSGGSFIISPTTMNIDDETGAINLGTGDVGTTYTITYTTPAGPCSNTSTFDVTITPLDDPSFAYGATDYCPYGTASPTYITTPGGTFSVSPAGLSVNALTGLIDFSTAVPGTSYTITYATSPGPCNDILSLVINVLPYTDAAFSYSDFEFCAYSSISPNYILNPGGTFSASAGISINSSTGEINLAASTPGGPYDIVYTTTGCTESDTFQLTILPLPVVAITVPDLICFESTPVTLIGDPPGGSFSGDGVIDDQFDPALAGSTGIYSVTYSYTDINGCTNTATGNISVIQNSVDAGLDVYIEEYTSAALYASGGATFQWDPSDSLSCSDCPDPITSIMTSTTFTVTSWDVYGCVDSDDVTVNVVPVFDVTVFVPNTFTPNGDQINDMFFAYGSDLVSILSMRVYDRWGEQLFLGENLSPLDPSTGWDGTFNGHELNEGVYVYIMEVMLEEGVRQLVKGNVTLLK